jgi:hypothetical protein
MTTIVETDTKQTGKEARKLMVTFGPEKKRSFVWDCSEVMIGFCGYK